MIEFRVGQAAITCHWIFKDSFIPLLEPGDKGFASLHRSLRPFGATLSSFSYEDEPESLAEEGLLVYLFNDRLKLRLGHAGFEFLLNDLWEDEEFSLVRLIQALSQALQEIDVDITQGSVRFLYEAFIN